VGVTGSNGTNGHDGVAGPPGSTGPPGLNGTNGVGSQGTPGAQGNQGVKGDKGDTGDTGAAGSNGAQGIQGPAWTPASQQASATYTVGNNAPGTATAACPTGKALLGGGYQITAQAGTLVYVDAYPNATNTGFTSNAKTGNGSSSVTVKVYAICAA
ncbi:MAG: hypothetical protein QOK36_846, partial [Gaiellales bacterium]|nr:hypothetical protein [Gaiellales bacterium]